MSEAVLVFLLAMLTFLVFWPLFTGVRGIGFLGSSQHLASPKQPQTHLSGEPGSG